MVHRLDDRILGEETGKERKTDQRQGAQQRGPVGDRHILAHAAHVTDVLVVMHADNHRACSKEQQRLEEGVGHQVEDAGGISGGTQGHHHVTQLRQGRVGHHSLDVVLHDADQPGEEGGGGADHQDEAERGLREFIQGRHARHHEDAGGDHGGGVDQRGDGGRTLHRVGQPDMQRHLGRFAHGADEEQDTDHRHQRPAAVAPDLDLGIGQSRRLGEDLSVVEAVGVHGDGGDAEDETEVTHAVDDEGLQVGEDRRRPHRPEADQQVGDQAHRLPAEEELEEVVGHHQHQHGEGEERDVAEEALIAVAPRQAGLGPIVLVIGHVADGVDMDAEGDEAHHADHHRGELIHQEAHLHVDAVAHHPGIDRAVEDLRIVEHEALEHIEREQGRDAHPRARHPVRPAAADGTTEKAGYDSAYQGRKHDCQIDIFHNRFFLKSPQMNANSFNASDISSTDPLYPIFKLFLC